MESLIVFVIYILICGIVRILVKNKEKRVDIYGNSFLILLGIFFVYIFFIKEREVEPEFSPMNLEGLLIIDEKPKPLFDRLSSYKGYTLENISIDTITNDINYSRYWGDSIYVEIKLTLIKGLGFKGDSIKNIWFMKDQSDFDYIGFDDKIHNMDDKFEMVETDSSRKHWINQE